MSQTYQFQLVIEVRKHYLQIFDVSGFEKKRERKSRIVTLPDGMIENGAIVQFDNLQKILKDTIRALKPQKGQCKVIFVMTCLTTEKIDLYLEPHDDLKSAIDRAVIKELKADPEKVLTQTIVMPAPLDKREHHMLFVTRNDLLADYENLMLGLDLDISLMEFQSPCLLNLVRNVRKDNKDFLALLNIGDDVLQVAYIDGAELVFFREAQLDLLSNPGARKGTIFHEIEASHELMLKTFPAAPPIRRILANNDGPLLAEYFSLKGGENAIPIILIEPLKTIVADKMPAPLAHQLLQTPGSGEFLEEAEAGTNARGGKTNAKGRAAGGSHFDRPRRSEVTRMEAPPKEKKPFPLIKWALILLVVVGVGTMLYSPDETGVKILDAKSFDDPYIKVGLPKVKPEEYEKIFKQLKDEKTKATTEGKPMSATREKQLKFLEDEKAKSAF